LVGHGQKETRTARSAGLQPEGEPRALYPQLPELAM